MPDGSTCSPGHSIILNAEDGAEDTIKPRLLLHGANEINISLLMGVRQNETEYSFSLKTDLDALEKAIIQTGCQLVVVDPLSAYMPHINQFRDGDVRSVLAPLSQLAEQYNVAVERLDLSSRTLNCLKRAGINKVGEVLEMSKPELLRIRNFGEKSYNELFGRLREMDLLPPDMDPQESEDASDGEAESVVVTETEPETVNQ